MLIETDNPDLQQYVSVSMENPDLSRAFETVRACSRIRDGRLQEALLQCVRDSDAAECFRRWLSQERRLTLLRRARGDVKDPALRFLLAVLLNAHTRSDAMALVAGHGSTSEPGRQVAAWLSQLSTIVFQLQVGNLPVQANVLGLPTFEQGFEQALANALDGSRGPESEAERQFLARLSELPVLSPLFA
jgi:hypothetical protein